jgi:hypothetical protein
MEIGCTLRRTASRVPFNMTDIMARLVSSATGTLVASPRTAASPRQLVDARGGDEVVDADPEQPHQARLRVGAIELAQHVNDIVLRRRLAVAARNGREVAVTQLERDRARTQLAAQQPGGSVARHLGDLVPHLGDVGEVAGERVLAARRFRRTLRDDRAIVEAVPAASAVGERADSGATGRGRRCARPSDG